jgi:hypothetical protein
MAVVRLFNTTAQSYITMRGRSIPHFFLFSDGEPIQQNWFAFVGTAILIYFKKRNVTYLKVKK